MHHKILIERIEAGGKRPAITPGPQAHIDAKHPAVTGRLIDRGDDALAKALKEVGVINAAPAVGLAIARVNKNQIDVRGHIQLTAAEFAHSDDDQALALALGHGGAEFGFEPDCPVRERACQAYLGQRTHGAHDFL